MSAITILEADPNDIGAITEILNEVILNTTAVWDDNAKSVEDMQLWLTNKAQHGLPVFVAKDGDDTVGYASFEPFRAWPGYSKTVEHSIYVAAPSRDTGIGSALLEALMARAKQDGYHVMVGGITNTNTASINLHKKFGFKETAKMPEVGQKFGSWQTLLFLQYKLNGKGKSRPS